MRLSSRRRIITLDFDIPYSTENLKILGNWIAQTAQILQIPLDFWYCEKSHSGNTHCYVYTKRDITHLEHIMFEIYAGSDRGRIKADWKRIKHNYPVHPFYLFSSYSSRPQKKGVCYYDLGELELYILHYALKNIGGL